MVGDRKANLHRSIWKHACKITLGYGDVVVLVGPKNPDDLLVMAGRVRT